MEFSLLCIFLAYFCPIFGHKLTFINKNSSAIKLRSNVWRKSPFIFHIEANSDNGNIFTVVNQQKENIQLQLNCGQFHLNQNSAAKTSQSMLNKMVARQWNKIKLNQNDVLQKMQLLINDVEEFQLPLSKWGTQNWEEVWIGAYKDEITAINDSFVGCLHLDNKIGISNWLEERSLVLKDCVDACEYQNCENGGKCINNYKNITCDCIGTGYEGNTCDKVSKALQMTNGGYFESNNIPISSIYSLTIRMRTKKPSGILFQSNLSKEAVEIQLQNGSLHMIISTAGNTFSTNLGYGLHDNTWHFIQLSIAETMVKVSINDQYENMMNIKPPIKRTENTPNNHTQPHKIVIGGRKEKSFKGCLQHIQVNNINVINSILKKEGYFKTFGNYRECIP